MRYAVLYYLLQVFATFDNSRRIENLKDLIISLRNQLLHTWNVNCLENNTNYSMNTCTSERNTWQHSQNNIFED